MNEHTKQKILAHANAEYPRECCGLLVNREGREYYHPCKNIAQGTDHFAISPEDYANAEDIGEVIAVIHSHPNASPQPSQADKVSCEASGLPWHIVSIPNEQWASFQPTGYKAPLIGREFYHGVLDCYALIRDWYSEEKGIALPDFFRTDDWWNKGQNLYLENFEKAGFFRVDEDPRPGDVLLMQILAPVPNHGAVYLGDDLILQHLHGRLSGREIWGGYYKKHTTHILRHKQCAK